MLKFILFFLTISIPVFSQTEIKVVLQDFDSKEPISNATITILRTNQGLLSNEEGVFIFNNEKPSLIEIIHSSYKKKAIKSITLKDSINVIFLEQNVRDLDEIILTNESPQNILKSLIKNSTKKLTIPANLKVYSREFFKKNDSYIFYNDGLLNFQLYDANKGIKSEILVEQNRCIGFVDSESHEILGYNLNNIMENYYKFNYLNILFEPIAKKRYEFLVKAHATNSNYRRIVVKPYYDQNGPYSTFEIVYDATKKLIISVSSFLPNDRVSQDKKFLDFKNRSIFKSTFLNNYRIEGTDYYLANSMEEIGFTITVKKKEEKIEVKNYLNTTAFRTKVFNYNPVDVFKEKSLIFIKNSILTNFWDLESGIALTEKEKDIINNIQK